MKRLNTTFSAIRRTPYQSLAAIIMTTLTFFSVSILTLSILGASRMLAFFESRPQVTAFFKDDATASSSASLEDKIKSRYAIEASKYLSKEDALAIYQDQNQDNPLLLEMVTADILPASLEISAKNVDDLEKIANLMQEESTVEEVVFQKDVIDTLRKWLGGIRVVGIFLTSMLTVASVTTIIVIIGLKFRSKKTEVYTLSLLGATHWYIRAPFIIESIVYGLVGALIGWGIAYTLLLYLTPNLVTFLGDIPLLPVPLWVMGLIAGGELILGTIIGALSSLIATRRYGR